MPCLRSLELAVLQGGWGQRGRSGTTVVTRDCCQFTGDEKRRTCHEQENRRTAGETNTGGMNTPGGLVLTLICQRAVSAGAWAWVGMAFPNAA